MKICFVYERTIIQDQIKIIHNLENVKERFKRIHKDKKKKKKRFFFG